MRTIAQIERDIAEAEAMAASDLAGNKIYTGEQRKVLYAKRAEALREELASAERARQAILAMAQHSGANSDA